MFDEAMAAADEAAFALLSAARAKIWQAGQELERREVKAIEMPRGIGGDYRAGGRVPDVNFVLEVEAAPLRAQPVVLGPGGPEVQEGWLVEWKAVTYRIQRIIWQGETATLELGSRADSSGGW